MAKRKTFRVILDTNWYISASINRNSRRTLYDLITDRRITIVYSSEILHEYTAVLARPRFRKLISSDLSHKFIRLVLPQLEEAVRVGDIALGRDESDHYLIALAIENDIDCLVTGDYDLLEISEVGRTKIITMRKFLALIAR